MQIKQHFIIALVMITSFIGLGSNTSVLQASLNLRNGNLSSIEEFHELQNQTLKITINNEHKQLLGSNLRLKYNKGLIQTTEETRELLESIFNNVNKTESADLIVKNQGIYLKPAITGKQVNLNTLEKKLNSKNFKETKSIALNAYQITPEYTTQQAQTDMVLTKELANQRLVFYTDSELNYKQSQAYSALEFSKYYKSEISINQKQLLELLEEFKGDFNKQAYNIKIQNLEQNINIEDTGMLGQKLLVNQSIEKVKTAIEHKQNSVELVYQTLLPEVYNFKGGNSKWRAISYGVSDYTGSIINRVKNIQMASQNVFQNTIVNPGKDFSYNDTLIKNGSHIEWKNAFIIVNGQDLQEAPGGGLCQVSTTIYRAAIKAGFPINKIRNHSLYVKYYKKHGDGLDATIYPGAQDMTFTNNLSTPILIQTYYTADNKNISIIYGLEEPQDSNLYGPYYSMTENPYGLTINNNQIIWVRETEGKSQPEIFTSTYNQRVL